MSDRREYFRTYYKKNKESYKVAMRKYRQTQGAALWGAHKAVARRKLRDAVKWGHVEKPSVCNRCPTTKNIQGHHDDYYKPLEVIWLCSTCHNILHYGKE